MSITLDTMLDTECEEVFPLLTLPDSFSVTFARDQEHGWVVDAVSGEIGEQETADALIALLVAGDIGFAQALDRADPQSPFHHQWLAMAGEAWTPLGTGRLDG